MSCAGGGRGETPSIPEPNSRQKMTLRNESRLFCLTDLVAGHALAVLVHVLRRVPPLRRRRLVRRRRVLGRLAAAAAVRISRSSVRNELSSVVKTCKCMVYNKAFFVCTYLATPPPPWCSTFISCGGWYCCCCCCCCCCGCW